MKAYLDEELNTTSIDDQMQLGIPHYQKDKAFINSILSVGKYAISHSPEYREAYHPHYRIVERSIFEHELKPLIERKYSQNKNNDIPHAHAYWRALWQERRPDSLEVPRPKRYHHHPKDHPQGKDDGEHQPLRLHPNR